MSYRFGQFGFCGTRYFVCSTNSHVRTNLQANLAQLNHGTMRHLFLNGRIGNAATTIWETDNLRLDLQNGNIGVVHVMGHGVDPIDFDNLSIQSGGESLAVLYLQTPFAGIGSGIANYRAQFTNYTNNTDDRSFFLRLIYTWLMMSNAHDQKYCICTQNLAGSLQPTPGLANGAAGFKTGAMVSLP